LTERLRDLPIRQQLLVIVLLTTVTALLAAGAEIAVWDASLYRLAEIIADNSLNWLAVDDTVAAMNTLAPCGRDRM
jgi:hypothetical protein